MYFDFISAAQFGKLSLATRSAMRIFMLMSVLMSIISASVPTLCNSVRCLWPRNLVSSPLPLQAA